MTILKSPESTDYVEFEKIDSTDANGNLTSCFSWKTSSKGFSAETKDVWFYDYDLVTFCHELQELIEQNAKKVLLEAMSNLKICVVRDDQLGHFIFLSEMNSPVFGNSARISVKLETANLIVLEEELSKFVQKP